MYCRLPPFKIKSRFPTIKTCLWPLSFLFSHTNIKNMSKDFTKKAVELLLKGATLVSDPCPYCKGVRIMKDGNEGKEESNIKIQEKIEKPKTPSDKLDQKIKELTDELEKEKDYEKQQQILRSINEIISIKEKLRKT